MDNLEKAVKIAKELERRKVTNIMADYKPYEYQKKFHNTLAQQRLLMAGIGSASPLAGPWKWHIM